MTTIRKNPPGTERTERHRVVRVNPVVRTDRPIPHTPDPAPDEHVRLRSIGVEGLRGKTGAQGPQGPVGPPGPGGALDRVQANGVAAVNINAFRVVIPTDAGLILADNTIVEHADRPMWLTLTAALVGETVVNLVQGVTTNETWNWGTGLIFLGTEGQITQTPPDSANGAAFLVVLAQAISPTSLSYERGPAVRLA